MKYFLERVRNRTSRLEAPEINSPINKRLILVDKVKMRLRKIRASGAIGGQRREHGGNQSSECVLIFCGMTSGRTLHRPKVPLKPSTGAG
jgi:hypothetical protein